MGGGIPGDLAEHLEKLRLIAIAAGNLNFLQAQGGLQEHPLHQPHPTGSRVGQGGFPYQGLKHPAEMVFAHIGLPGQLFQGIG